MSSTAVFVLEGGLRQHVGEAVIPVGKRLYHGLATQMRIAVLSESTETARNLAWLKDEGFDQHVYYVGRKEHDPTEKIALRLRQIARLREGGCVIDLVVEPDPEIAAALLRNGITVVPLLVPQFARPEFRPDWDGSAVPWDTLVNEIDAQRSLRGILAGDLEVL
jgi:hypothetical protein